VRAILIEILGGALMMQARHWQKAAPAVLTATTALFLASWWTARHPYSTPGTHQTVRMDSSAGALLGFLVLVIVAPMPFLIRMEGRRAARVCALIIASYLGVIVMNSLLTPRKIVSVGDRYCWDIWCMSVQNVSATPNGSNTLYTAQVRISTDSNHAQSVPVGMAKQFLYIRDEQGRRFPILQDSSLKEADVTLEPGESVASSVAFLAPANEAKLYLSGDIGALPWERLYLGSDLNPLHRTTLLRIN
jgi:hypothetical protein